MFFTQFLDEAFGPKTLKMKKAQIYGKGSWKTSLTRTSSLQPRGPVGEKAPCPRRPPNPAPHSLPQGSALNLFQLQTLSHSLFSTWPTFSSFHLPPSLPPSLIRPCLFTFSIPLSHFLVLCDCPTPSHSYPLTDQIGFLLEPVLMASFQEQQV